VSGWTTAFDDIGYAAEDVREEMLALEEPL
jgi:hypothetical protein